MVLDNFVDDTYVTESSNTWLSQQSQEFSDTKGQYSDNWSTGYKETAVWQVTKKIRIIYPVFENKVILDMLSKTINIQWDKNIIIWMFINLHYD